MKIWSAAEAQKATEGKLIGNADWEVLSICIDSRLTKQGDLFIALRGTKTDGHDFIHEALRKGAAAIMAEKLPDNLPSNASVLLVDDCIKALYKLAEYRRAETKAKIIAVTGSVGKTSTKEMLNIAFSVFGLTHASAGNNNNEIGAPLSLAKMPPNAEFGIFELGMNHINEISPLTKLIRPHITIITNVEAVHIENFKNIEEIARAKAEIFDGLDKNGTAILNIDNKFFEFLSEQAKLRGISKIISFGDNSLADAKLLEHESSTSDNIIHSSISGNKIDFHISARGKHMAINALAVLAAVQAAGLNIKESAIALSGFSAQKGRGQILQIPLGNGKFTIIDESYNASPPAMRAALGNLAETQTQGRRIAVIGDMLELGKLSTDMHKAVAADIIRNNIDLVFTVGPHSQIILANLPEEIRGQSVENAEQLLPILQNTLRSEDVVLVKASHGIGLGKLVENLSKVNAHAI